MGTQINSSLVILRLGYFHKCNLFHIVISCPYHEIFQYLIDWVFIAGIQMLLLLHQINSIIPWPHNSQTWLFSCRNTDVIIIAPDSDNLSILQAGVAGVDLRQHQTLAFQPGEVRKLELSLIPADYSNSSFACRDPPLCTQWYLIYYLKQSHVSVTWLTCR